MKSELMKGAYQYIKMIVDKAIKENKKLLLWGYGKGGVYARHLVRDIDGRIDFSAIIDDFLYVPYAPETMIFRSSYLDYVDCDDYILLSSVKNNDEINHKILEYGFKPDVNYFDVRKVIKSSNIEYIESVCQGLDFSYVTKEDCKELYSGDNYESKPFDHSSIDKVTSEISKLTDNISFFDYGCGKGQILISAFFQGIDDINGIELNKDIFEVAKTNFEIMNIDSNIICGDATLYKNIDKYNVFFFYNPFGGEVFEKVIRNIEESVNRCNRRVYIAYGNPFNHKCVIKNGVFSLVKQIPVDLYDPLFNIYSN